MKKIKIYLIIAFLIVLNSTPAMAYMCVKYDHLGRKHTYVCPEPPRITEITIHYKNGKVNIDKMCEEYKSGSHHRRDCIREAQKIFNERCKNGDSKYCTAHSQIKFKR